MVCETKTKSGVEALRVILGLACLLPVAQADPEVTAADQILFRQHVSLFQDGCIASSQRVFGDLTWLVPSSQPECGGPGSDWFGICPTGFFTAWAPRWVEYSYNFVATEPVQEIGVNAMNVFSGDIPPSFQGFQINVYIDGALVNGPAPSMVVPGSNTEARSSSAMTTALTSGNHTIRIEWLNDENPEGPFDANIMIASVFLNGAYAVGIPPSVEMLNNLVATVDAFNLQPGIRSSLQEKLSAAESLLQDANLKNDGAACNILEAIIHEAEAQRGKKMTQAQADELIAATGLIVANVCHCTDL